MRQCTKIFIRLDIVFVDKNVQNAFEMYSLGKTGLSNSNVHCVHPPYLCFITDAANEALSRLNPCSVIVEIHVNAKNNFIYKFLYVQ